MLTEKEKQYKRDYYQKNKKKILIKRNREGEYQKYKDQINLWRNRPNVKAKRKKDTKIWRSKPENKLKLQKYNIEYKKGFRIFIDKELIDKNINLHIHINKFEVQHNISLLVKGK